MSAEVIPRLTAPSYAALPQEHWPNVDQLVTEDNTPVDNLFSEKQMRLLCEALYASWQRGGPFLALANVGLFYKLRLPPLVPDVMLSLDVEAPKDLWLKANRSYFLWEYGKPPELVVEIVSNREGEELGSKRDAYAAIGVAYYVVYDPEVLLGQGPLLAFSLRDKVYEPMEGLWFPAVGLGLSIWHGKYEGAEADWLRWCEREGKLIMTGSEQKQRADRMDAKLRQLGIEPDSD